MRIHPDKIRNFLAMARHLNFSKAAEAQCVTQQTLSRSIQRLEHELGQKLFVRNVRPPHSLTDFGQLFFQKCQALERNWQSTLEHMRQLPQRTLSMGLSGPIPPGIIPLLAQLQLEHPEVYLKMYAIPAAEQEDALHDGRLDLGLSHQALKVKHSEALFSSPYVIATRQQGASHWQELAFILVQAQSEESHEKIWNPRHTRTILTEVARMPHALRLCQQQGAVFLPQCWLEDHSQTPWRIDLAPPERQMFSLYLNGQNSSHTMLQSLYAKIQSKLQRG